MATPPTDPLEPSPARFGPGGRQPGDDPGSTSDVADSHADSADDDEGPCSLCGRRPAWYLEFDQNIGLVLYRHVRTWKGVACKPCGTEVGRTYLRRTMRTGWWGIVSLPANVLAIRHNRSVLRELHSQPDPA